MNTLTNKLQLLIVGGAMIAYLVVFLGLALTDLIRDRQLQKKLGVNYEGPLAD